MRWNETGVAFSRPIRWLLALLGEEAPIDMVSQAMATAVEYQYDPTDLVLMQTLADGLRTWYPGSPEVP